MTDRTRFWLLVFAGTGLVAGGAWVAVTGTPGEDPGSLVRATAILVAVLGLLLALWHVSGTPDGTADAGEEREAGGTDRATPGDVLAGGRPETASTRDRLSGRLLAERLEAAGQRAREEGRVEAGLERLRPVFRGTLVAALVQGGTDRSRAESAVDSGAWTDDRIAASVLSASVDPPSLSFRERVVVWLFPERVLRARARRAVGEIAAVAAESLPAVPGQHAPRNIPVVTPSLEELRRNVEGDLEPAVEVAATTDLLGPGSDGTASTPDGGSDGDPSTADGDPSTAEGARTGDESGPDREPPATGGGERR